MDVKYLIADSGGSSTCWTLVYENNETTFFQTRSLHPKYAFTEKAEILEELQKTFKGLHVPLYFYGAGCASGLVQEEMESFLLQVGFSRVEVQPDTLAACRALYGKQPGWLGILGTGSILVHYDGNRIIDRIGGYGSLIGDEGSGFYFGKLLVRFLLDSPEWETSWIELFESKPSVLSKLASADAQKWIADLARQTAHLPLDFLHRKNAELFLERYVLNIPDPGQIAFIGTYGFEQRAIFEEVFKNQGITIVKCLPSPMADLLRFHLTND
ncbi:hypothetical protein [Fluviicola sp.]|jgi:N-acetylglucosamine kinase-like BadF-type ATPase|uniref:hypothetical protein n=1 Tax=Fluviicola sp. TaxID=1917219 RepID=UPI00282C8DE0|nr:hypothetical protein [Fluviicola sp.]MDR0803030.1 hypothetical protein [Fluviicola sp.]